MRALVISGGGSKGAFAGGVAEYLISIKKRKYELLLGTSTGSLLIPHLSLGKIDKIRNIYTNVHQRWIFNLNPFVVKRKGNRQYIGINFGVPLLQFLKRRRTFGESKNLRKNIRKNFLESEFHEMKSKLKDVVVTVSNLTKNCVEYKSMRDCNYEDFCDWIWISCNYIPFMSITKKNNYEYADGGFGCMVPIREAIRRGATTIDAIILESEIKEYNKILGNNPFSLMVNLYGFMIDQVSVNDVIKGKLEASNKGVTLNLYYTPSKLTENSLIFNKNLMKEWWQLGFKSAKEKFSHKELNELRNENLDKK